MTKPSRNYPGFVRCIRADGTVEYKSGDWTAVNRAFPAHTAQGNKWMLLGPDGWTPHRTMRDCYGHATSYENALKGKQDGHESEEDTPQP